MNEFTVVTPLTKVIENLVNPKEYPLFCLSCIRNTKWRIKILKMQKMKRFVCSKKLLKLCESLPCDVCTSIARVVSDS